MIGSFFLNMSPLMSLTGTGRFLVINSMVVSTSCKFPVTSVQFSIAHEKLSSLYLITDLIILGSYFFTVSIQIYKNKIWQQSVSLSVYSDNIAIKTHNCAWSALPLPDTVKDAEPVVVSGGYTSMCALRCRKAALVQGLISPCYSHIIQHDTFNVFNYHLEKLTLTFYAFNPSKIIRVTNR